MTQPEISVVTAVLPDGYKRCTKCKSLLRASTDYFSRLSKARDGFNYWCKQCQRVQHRIPVKKPNPRHTPKELKALKAARDKKYAEKHAEKIRAYQEIYYDAHSIKAKLRAKQWSKNNSHQAKATRKKSKAQRRATERQSEGSFLKDDVLRLYEEQDGMCAYCGIRLYEEYHADHVQPLSRGGTNWPENLALSCPDCNFSKANKTMAEWRRRRGW